MVKDLQDKILNYRAMHRISAADFAKECGLTVQTIYAIENGYQNASKITERKILQVIEKDKKTEN